jgi:hypothetical protein
MLQDTREIIGRVSGREGPMLSAYVSVNPAVPENQGQAYKVRLREGMNGEGVPEGVQDAVRERVEGERHPGARTLVVFASEDGAVELSRLQVDLPESYRWGESYVAPLVLALDEHEPYGVALLDAERFRYFVSSPLAPPPEGAEVVAGSGYRELDLHPSQPHPRGGGSTDMDPAGRTQQANIHRFYKDLGETVRKVTFQEGVKRLILAGPKERTAEFRKALPTELQQTVVAEEPVALGAPEGEILDRLEQIREDAEHRRVREILDDIRERGVRGLDETVGALQEENRVYHLVALWDLGDMMRWCDNDDLVVRDPEAGSCPFCGQPTRERPTLDALVDLTAARGARLDFVRGENENAATLHEFGGLAGLTRF